MTESRLAPEEVRTRTFTRVVRGYRRKEVRRLLERAAADLARLRNGLPAAGPDDLPPLTPQEVEEARFQPALGGYEMDEVDEFLDQLVVELERAVRDPLRPPSALPAPTRQASFPAAGPGPASSPVPAPVPAPGPSPRSRPRPCPWSRPRPRSQPPGPRTRPPGPAPGPAAAARARRSPAVGPAARGRLPPAAGPLPAAPPSAGRQEPGPRTRVAGAGPAPDEGFFPPESVPPSAAPAPPPPAPPLAARPPAPTPARPLTPSEVETRTFERGAPGYLPNHVDLFLAKAARALAGRDGETLSRWDVLRQRFPLGPRGYAATR